MTDTEVKPEGDFNAAALAGRLTRNDVADSVEVINQLGAEEAAAVITQLPTETAIELLDMRADHTGKPRSGSRDRGGHLRSAGL